MSNARPSELKIDLVGEGCARAPVVSGADIAVGRIVEAAHEQGIAAALERWAGAGLSRASLEPILAYCAERRCEADNATCPGCRLRTQKQGLDTFDAFVAHHAEITFKSSKLRLAGSGFARLVADSLEQLARSWAGEEYWFWARRVIRKLRHGLRRTAQSGKPTAEAGETPAIVLVEPQLADNIGMVARAMANFGLDTLRLVAPRDGWPNEKARVAASGANYVVDEARAFPTLEAALGDLTWVAATTARQRELTKPVLSPAQAVAEIRTRIAQRQRCGIVFGRERNGLETSEIANADAIVMVPVSSRFASLNLAQAVLICGYEWIKDSPAATLGRVTTYETPLEPGLNLRASAPATKEELIGFFEHLERELDASGFLNPPEKRPSMQQNLRTMFTRMGATEQEIRTLRGIVKALAHPKRSGRRLP